MRARLQHQIEIVVLEMPLHAGALRSKACCGCIAWVGRAQQNREVRLVLGAPAHGEDHPIA